MHTLAQAEPDATLLKQDLATLEQFGTVIKELNGQIRATMPPPPGSMTQLCRPGSRISRISMRSAVG